MFYRVIGGASFIMLGLSAFVSMPSEIVGVFLVLTGITLISNV